MKFLAILLLAILVACNPKIKNEKEPKEQPELEVDDFVEIRPEANRNLIVQDYADILGYWVGWFEADISEEQRELLHEKGIKWSYQNKINISIDSINGNMVKGHSVVANNYRPFEGEVELKANIYTFRVKEPGDHAHDGSFLFQIAVGDSIVKGYWESYGDLNIKRRKYHLGKKFYEYDSSLVLSGWYTDFDKIRSNSSTFDLNALLKEYKTKKNIVEQLYGGVDTNEITNEGLDRYIEIVKEQVEWRSEEVFSVTNKVFDYNSSAQLLSKEFVENLTKADIYILRNSIFARHGYSFKDRKLRTYFDWQDWYIPVHANIKTDITDIEKANIALLLKYEEHAEEYYDEFGR